jgi:RNA recognition motif-containing protein
VAPGVSEQQIIDYFESAGAVESIKILPANSRFPTGVAYVNFGIAEHATTALNRFNGAVPSWNAGITVRIQRQEPLAPSHAHPGGRPSSMHGSTHAMSSAQGTTSAQDLLAVAGAKDWVQLLSRSTGKFYWFNKATNQSTWHVPGAVLAARSAAAKVPPLPPSSLARWGLFSKR